MSDDPSATLPACRSPRAEPEPSALAELWDLACDLAASIRPVSGGYAQRARLLVERWSEVESQPPEET